MYALMVKRYNYFKRDLKGLLFLILIPIATVLAIVALLKVSSCCVNSVVALLCLVLALHQQ